MEAKRLNRIIEGRTMPRENPSEAFAQDGRSFEAFEADDWSSTNRSSAIASNWCAWSISGGL